MSVDGGMSERELAEHYGESQDASDFDDGDEVAIKVKRNVTISVRFSEDEIADLRKQAAAVDMKVTSFIRASALEATRPVDRGTLHALVRDLEQRAHDVASLVRTREP